MGEISPRISSRPDCGSATPSAATRDRHRRYRPASRKIRSAARGGSAPPAAPGSWRRRSGWASPGSRIPSLVQQWTYRSGRMPRLVLPRTRVRLRGLPSGITKRTRHGPQRCQKAAQHPRVTNLGMPSKASPSGGREPTSPAAPLPSGRLSAGRSQVRGNCASPAARRQAVRQTYPLGHSRYISLYRAFPAIRRAFLVVFAGTVRPSDQCQASRAEHPQ